MTYVRKHLFPKALALLKSDELKRVRERPETSEDGWVSAAPVFANDGPRFPILVSSALGDRIATAVEYLSDAPGAPWIRITKSHRLEAALAAEFAEELDSLASGDPRREEAVMRGLRDRDFSAKMLFAPIATFSTEQGLQLEQRPMFLDVRAALDYILALLLDRSRPYYGRVHRCALASCNVFFISAQDGPGTARYRYCCEEHQKAADRLLSAERVRRMRQRRRAQRKPK